ncbi:MAG: Tfp pilus assembly protein FimT [uncultured Paraburkholderia sp.]|nr:MAG: Tfp pilus assembly protein FimT [uncultured Paraburkholderia sp.]CAH2801363.1 MAG: Tfp pilus assembly protein FimT [uncultured Paraburkholderia sp.]CAH2936308.1 MAG: Tfp pilus assembly protein FimT [uncultured Paraburkholderia sp.]CAH2937959.1 MAG: Tfp pilus assembly protein FimT [uncultured Paraburkholderia sp.]
MKQHAIASPPCGAFTLVETLVVIALFAVIVVMATPSFVAWHVRDQVDARAKALLSTLSYARSEALRRGARVTVCRTDAARHCLAAGQPCGNGVTDWSCGWAVLADRGGTPTLLRAHGSLAAVSIVGIQTNLTFTPPAGQLIGTFRSFDIAPRAPSRATQGDKWRRCIRIAAGGRTRMVDSACGAAS